MFQDDISGTEKCFFIINIIKHKLMKSKDSDEAIADPINMQPVLTLSILGLIADEAQFKFTEQCRRQRKRKRKSHLRKI